MHFMMQIMHNCIFLIEKFKFWLSLCGAIRKHIRSHAQILLDGYRISHSDNISPNNCLFVNNEL